MKKKKMKKQKNVISVPIVHRGAPWLHGSVLLPFHIEMRGLSQNSRKHRRDCKWIATFDRYADCTTRNRIIHLKRRDEKEMKTNETASTATRHKPTRVISQHIGNDYDEGAVCVCVYSLIFLHQADDFYGLSEGQRNVCEPVYEATHVIHIITAWRMERYRKRPCICRCCW